MVKRVKNENEQKMQSDLYLAQKDKYKRNKRGAREETLNVQKVHWEGANDRRRRLSRPFHARY